jgi:hypothetical protein
MGEHELYSSRAQGEGTPGRVASAKSSRSLALDVGLEELDRFIARYGMTALGRRPLPTQLAKELSSIISWLCASAQDNGSDGADGGSEGAERLVIELHAAWPTLPSVQAVAYRPEARALLAFVITQCIGAFYSPRSD